MRFPPNEREIGSDANEESIRKTGRPETHPLYGGESGTQVGELHEFGED